MDGAASFQHVHNFRDFGAEGAHRGRGRGNLGAEGADEDAELGRGGRGIRSAPSATWSVTGVLSKNHIIPFGHPTNRNRHNPLFFAVLMSQCILKWSKVIETVLGHCLVSRIAYICWNGFVLPCVSGM